MTKLTAKQTEAMVKYLRGVKGTTAMLGGPVEGTVTGMLADALERGDDLDAIKGMLSAQALIELLARNGTRAGLAAGFIAAINMVEKALEAEREQVFKSEYLADYTDENRGRL